MAFGVGTCPIRIIPFITLNPISESAKLQFGGSCQRNRVPQPVLRLGCRTRSAVACNSAANRRAGFGNPYLVRVAEPDPQCRAIQQRTDGLGSATRISLGLLNPVRRHSRHQRANGGVGFCNSNHNSVAEPDSSVSRGGFRFRRRIGFSNNTVWIGIGC